MTKLAPLGIVSYCSQIHLHNLNFKISSAFFALSGFFFPFCHSIPSVCIVLECVRTRMFYFQFV